MSEAEPHVVLFTSGLLSKWGFNDGDVPETFLDYCDEIGIAYPEWPLERMVRDFVLPALDQRVEVTVISTNHNPVRAVTVDGRNVEDEWYGDVSARSRLTPESVSVPVSAILAMTAATKAEAASS